MLVPLPGQAIGAEPATSPRTAGGFLIQDAEGNEIQIDVMPSGGDRLLIWFLDRDESPPEFEAILRALTDLGVEVWRVDLLAAYFLTRTHENQRSLPGDGVAAVLAAAHRHSGKRVLAAAHDRMALPLLRGVHQWQSRYEEGSRLGGVMLFYPNLFGPSPVAGRDPVLDPIVRASSIPLVLVQPQHGTLRWRLAQTMQAFWSTGTPAYAYLVPNVRNYYFMHEDGRYPAETAARQALPRLIGRFAELLEATPEGPVPPRTTPASPNEGQIYDLVEITPPVPAPALALTDWRGHSYRLADYAGKVVLVNFWATWCPPCVEEVPSLNALARRYADRDFKLLSVDFQETPEQLSRFIERIPVDFPVLMDRDGRVSHDWRVFAFPSSFLLDRQGRIRYSVNRALDWNTPATWSVIEALLE